MTIDYLNPILPPDSRDRSPYDYDGIRIYPNKIGDIYIDDVLTHANLNVSHYDLVMMPSRPEPLEHMVERVVSVRKDVLRFFSRKMLDDYRPIPVILLFGSYGPVIADALRILAYMTHVDFAPYARGAMYEYDQSVDWCRSHPGEKYSKYRMNAEVKGFERVYSEGEYYMVSEGLRLLSRVEWEVIGCSIWNK